MVIAALDTPLGPATAASDGDALTGFWFVGQKYYPRGVADWTRSPDAAPFAALREWLSAYFAGQGPACPFPLRPEGTAFQRAVWALLLTIPHGETTTYGRLAAELAARQGLPSMSAQAVGGAVGHNPISLLIPCHRVLGASGALTGYAGGIEKKEALLRLEGARF